MRWTALPLLVAATGCNWVFGLQQTRPIDAPPDSPDAPDAAIVRMLFERQVGTTDSTGVAVMGLPVAISPAPMIQTGPMPGMLEPADYDETTRTFIVPSDLPGNAWRLVYTSDFDPLPTEIQWKASVAHLVLPWLERPGDSPPPPGSGWDFKVQGTTPNIGKPQVMTSGAFTKTDATADLAGPSEVTFHYAQHANPIFSPLGTPKVAQGDWELLYDFRLFSVSPQIYRSLGYAWAQADLVSGSLTTVTPTWTTGLTTISGLNWQDIINQNRMAMLSNLGGTCCTYHLEYGILPSPYIAPFVPSATGIDTTSMVQLYVEDNSSASNSIMVVDPTTMQVPLPRVFLGATQRARTANGVTLTNTLQILGTGKTLTSGAPLALAATLAGVPLNAGADNQSVPASTSAMTLTWNAEQNATVTLVADDWVVTLYEVAASTLTPIRRYQVLSPRVDIDGTLLQSGHRYVFGITSRAGFPGAQQADYSMVSLPFSEATVFPSMFVIN